MSFIGADLDIDFQGLKPKLDIINVNLFDFDIESWLNEDIPDSDMLLDGFESPFICHRPDRLGGGVKLYTKNNIVSKRRTDLEVRRTESIWLAVVKK